MRNLENQVQCLLSALQASGHQQQHPDMAAASRFGSAGGVEGEGDADDDADDLDAYDAAGGGGGDHSQSATAAAARAQRVQQRSEAAMEELSVMMWRTNIGDGVTIISDDATGSSHKVDSTSCESPVSPSPPPPPPPLSSSSSPPSSVQAPASILSYCAHPALVHSLAQSFLDNINAEHQFTGYQTTDFVRSYPHERCDLAFLHSAMLASGATFSSAPGHAGVGDEFARFAESLVFTCFREAPSIHVVQGLCILSERALALGRDHFGWIFISMAAGMSVHLRLHVLALDECAARAFRPSRDDIRTFWMFYMTDRTAISILGRNCVLPWRRANVPSFDATLATAAAVVPLSELSFSWQCKLWYLHDNYMDQIFSSGFESMPHAQQVQLLVATHDALRTFYQSRDPRLDIAPNAGVSKHVLFFHMAYQMAQLITLPPFLRCFTAAAASSSSTTTSPSSPSSSSQTQPRPDQENVTVLILRSLTGAASTMIRLVRMYRDVVGWHALSSSSSTATSSAHPPPPSSSPSTGKPNPVIIHYLLSAAIVQLMNATSGSSALRKSSARQLRVCMDLLAQLRGPWRPRADKSIKVIRVLAQRWGVLGALPMHYSYRVEPVEQEPVAPGAGSGMGHHNRDSHDMSSALGMMMPTPTPPTTTTTTTADGAGDPSMGILGSSWASTDSAAAAAAAASIFAMANMGMSDASPPTDGFGSLDESALDFMGHNMAAAAAAATTTTTTTSNLDLFDTMAGGTYVNWMHEFEALNGYDWAATADMNDANF